MENQNSSSLCRKRIETTFIRYTVNDRGNQRYNEGPIDSLSDAVDAYRPDAELVLIAGDFVVELDVGRDIYGLHKDLLKLGEALVFGAPSYGLCAKEADLERDRREIYTLVLTDFNEPPIFCFSREDSLVSIQTRTLMGASVKPDNHQNNDFPVMIGFSDLLTNICDFLQRFLDDLVHAYPEVTSFDDYKEYRVRLAVVTSHLGASEPIH